MTIEKPLTCEDCLAYLLFPDEEFVIDNILLNLKFLSSINKEIHADIYNVGLDSKVDFFKKKLRSSI